MPVTNNLEDPSQPPPWSGEALSKSPAPPMPPEIARVEHGQSGMTTAQLFAMADPSIPDPLAVVAPPDWSLPSDYAEGMVPDDVKEALMAQPTAVGEPKLGPVPSAVVHLPRGLYNVQEQRFQPGAVVRELTGADEEFLGKFQSPIDQYNNVISLGTVQLGGYDLSALPPKAKLDMVLDLMSGEMMMLYIAIVTATFGNQREYEFQCQNCQAELELTLSISQDMPFKLPEGEPALSYHYVTNGGVDLTYRPVTGKDENAVLEMTTTNRGEQNSKMLERIILEANGQTILNPAELVRHLGMRDRSRLLEVSASHQPTIDRSLNIDCPSCTYKNHFVLAVTDLFRP